MTGKLCLLTCSNFRQELEAAIAAEGWRQVEVGAFPARCGRPPVNWETLRAALPRDCEMAIALGRSCLSELRQAVPAALPPLQLLPQEQCFHLVAPVDVVDAAITRGAYLMTPAWLRHWRARLAEMGFADEDLRAFFNEFASRLVLLDTGIDPEAPGYLQAMGAHLGLPVERIEIGLAHTRTRLRAIIDTWERQGSQPEASDAQANANS